MKQIIHTEPGMGRGLINHDPRSKQYRATDLLFRGLAEPKTKTWRRGQAYNQHRTPHCVAHTGKGILNTSTASSWVPYRLRSRYSTDDMYHGAQAHDEWEGAEYDGTSGLGLCRFLKSIGRIREYMWCFGLKDTLLTLSYVGPIGLGVWWKSGMFDTDSSGYIRALGNNEGGHEVELMGVDVEEQCVIGMNSWGTEWGVNGRFKLTWTDLETLLGEQGDAFVITG